jgi:hypothetical protein
LKSAVFILLIFSSLTSFAQLSVEGQVIDGENNTPLPGANVFIANTTKGVSTGPDGKFKISGLLAIEYQLVVSFIGYKTYAFDFVPKEGLTFKVLLKPTVQTLSEVIVRAKKVSASKRAMYLKSFNEHFIGKSDNAFSCHLENPGILSFDQDATVLTAEADSALVLLNKGLGYRVKILLETYQYNSIRNALHYEGYMVYEPLEPSSESEKKRWAKNRLVAYYGSSMHFYRALYDHRANEEGYYYYFINPIVSDTVVKANSRLFNNRKMKVSTIRDERIIDSLSSTKKTPVLKYSGTLEIAYINEGESPVFQRAMRIPFRKEIQVSRMRLRAPAALLPDGRISPISAAEIEGYWAWELMAETLPLDYDPEEDLKITKGKY